MGPLTLTLTLTFILEVKFFCFKVFPFIHSNWCSCRICKTSFKFCSSVKFPILHHYFRSDSDVLHSHSWGNVRQCRERRATMCNYGNNNWQYSSLMKHRCDEASDTRKEKNHRLQQWSFRIKLNTYHRAYLVCSYLRSGKISDWWQLCNLRGGPAARVDGLFLFSLQQFCVRKPGRERKYLDYYHSKS